MKTFILQTRTNSRCEQCVVAFAVELFPNTTFSAPIDIDNSQNHFLNMKLTPAKAEIIGLLASDGTHYKYVSIETRYFPKRRKFYTSVRERERVDFGNLNIKLLKHFQNLLLQVYNYKPKITSGHPSIKVNITKNSIIGDLLKYTDYIYDRWIVPFQIKNSSAKVKAAFVHGLYEGDGVKLQKNSNGFQIRIEMMNEQGLLSVKELLRELDIGSFVSHCGRGMYRLTVHGIKNITKFKEIISPKFKSVTLGWPKLKSGNPVRYPPAERSMWVQIPHRALSF